MSPNDASNSSKPTSPASVEILAGVFSTLLLAVVSFLSLKGQISSVAFVVLSIVLLAAWVTFHANAAKGRAKVGTLDGLLVMIPVIIAIFDLTSKSHLGNGAAAIFSAIATVCYVAYFIRSWK
ncbi:hypothetical protein [Corynebacterium sp.]|uniref:hypothetical protein n=1 Tax=Corynebacterium sp. TaxID=1720 RepID=UPI0026DB3BDB|nr:hypothetical protein [Corynebacterium sp.]MDO4915521.1 hypothetical protein [Corynebacterium sp.]